MNECPISPMKSWDLWDVMGHLWDTLNHYSIRLFLICPISPITFTVKGMKGMYVCMYEYIATYIHTYIHTRKNILKWKKLWDLWDKRRFPLWYNGGKCPISVP